MEDTIWGRISGWLLSALLLIMGTAIAIFRRRNNDQIKELRKLHIAVTHDIKEHRQHLADHDKRIDGLSIHLEHMRNDAADIKRNVQVIHERISQTSKTLNDKLDRLLERQLDRPNT